MEPIGDHRAAVDRPADRLLDEESP